MNGKKKKTVPKGYRLKPSTHKLIRDVQKELNLSQEKVIRNAITQFYESINKLKKGKT